MVRRGIVQSFMAAFTAMLALIWLLYSHVTQVPYEPVFPDKIQPEALQPIGEILDMHMFYQSIQIPEGLDGKKQVALGIFLPLACARIEAR